MPPATRSRSQSQTAPYPTAGSSSRAANAQQTANTSRGTRATRSRSGSMVSNGTDEGGPRRVTRSQAKPPGPGPPRLAKVMEEVTQDLPDSDQGESEVEEDGTAVTAAQRMELRRSLVPAPGNNAGRPDTRLIFAPLTIEERAQRLYRDSGIVLQAVLDRRGESEGPFDMAMNAKWKNWEAARGSIFYNERLAHFLQRDSLSRVDDFDPFEQSVTLNKALRLTDIAAFARIIDSPEDAAESLDEHARDKKPCRALKEASSVFLSCCVPKPWNDRTALQLLVDLATQRVLSELGDLQEPLVTDGHLHPNVEDAFATEALTDLEGWSKLDNVMDEKTIAVNIWKEFVLERKRQLRRAEHLEVASGQFPYEEFKSEMLAYINDALADLDLDEVQGQPSVLEGFPSGRVYDEDVQEDEEIEEDEEDEMTIDKVIALPEPEEEERTRRDNAVHDTNLDQPEDDDGDMRFTQADMDQYLREQDQQEDVVPVPVSLAEEEEEEEIEELEAPEGSQWAVREGPDRMPIRQVLAGERRVQNQDQRRLIMAPAGPVDWESQAAEPSRSQQHPEGTRGERARTKKTPAAVVADRASGNREDAVQIDPLGDDLGDTNSVEPPNDQSITIGERREPVRPRPQPRQRDYRAGHLAHQPDVDLAPRATRGNPKAPEGDDEELRLAPQPPGNTKVFRLDPADDYLYDENRNPLHDRHGRPLRLYKRYTKMSNLTKDQANRTTGEGGVAYRSKMRRTWTIAEGLFLYREVQKVPIGCSGQPTAYVYKRFQTEPVFSGRTSNQIRDKMKDLVKRRRIDKLLVLGSARHYLPSTDKLHQEYQEERNAEQRRLSRESNARTGSADGSETDEEDDPVQEDDDEDDEEEERQVEDDEEEEEEEEEPQQQHQQPRRDQGGADTDQEMDEAEARRLE
ncbi:hypothetical protein HD553DRAFT_313480 [Filobasidium floriforme]|uniref:uncharacterized protein n=1 Tax=Filobasidium floriforme TaxID=5210 RepID=UPI001E8DFDD9|nr:uncharacterized protein HD553DRAFT_313480 [Filobasidium floriforme]KAH8083217.1 hypothetical protein HD553DRAFT_313480 [Filobasidium floriforme]